MLASAARRVGTALAQRRVLSGAPSLPEFDVVVVGGGVFGAATADAVARRGASCILVEQFEPGHTRGSSHGDGRIFRLAYAQRDYIRMMQAALPLWRELEAREVTAGRGELLRVTGGLDLAGPADHAHLSDLEATYVREGIPYERLEPDACAARFPQFEPGPGWAAVFQPDAGIIFASKAVLALWSRAAENGAATARNARVARIVPGDGGVGGVVEATDGRAWRARESVVVAGGAWMSGLAAALGLRLPTRVSEETISWHTPRADSGGSDIPNFTAFGEEPMPIFIPWVANGLGPYGYYGLPEVEVPGVKIGAHYAGPTVDPDARPPPGAARDAQHASAARLVRTLLPRLEPEPASELQCLYTCTPDHDFVLGPHPAHGRAVVLVGGGSGHGFKFGPAVGEVVASLALGAPPPFEWPELGLARFDPARFGEVPDGDEEPHHFRGAAKEGWEREP